MIYVTYSKKLLCNIFQAIETPNLFVDHNLHVALLSELNSVLHAIKTLHVHVPAKVSIV